MQSNGPGFTIGPAVVGGVSHGDCEQAIGQRVNTAESLLYAYGDGQKAECNDPTRPVARPMGCGYSVVQVLSLAYVQVDRWQRCKDALLCVTSAMERLLSAARQQYGLAVAMAVGDCNKP